MSNPEGIRDDIVAIIERITSVSPSLSLPSPAALRPHRSSFLTTAAAPSLSLVLQSRDKSVPIKELHAILKSNPEIDATVYLQHISSAFRRFVLDTLIKLGTPSPPSLSSSTSPSSSLSCPLFIATPLRQMPRRILRTFPLFLTRFHPIPCHSINLPLPLGLSLVDWRHLPRVEQEQELQEGQEELKRSGSWKDSSLVQRHTVATVESILPQLLP
jgi:hypothetical protein